MCVALMIEKRSIVDAYSPAKGIRVKKLYFGPEHSPCHVIVKRLACLNHQMKACEGTAKKGTKLGTFISRMNFSEVTT